MPKPSQPHQIIILTALNGFKVKAGCAEILFTDPKKLLNELKRYLENPEKVEEEYMEKALYQQDTTEYIEPETTRTGGARPSVSQLNRK